MKCIVCNYLSKGNHNYEMHILIQKLYCL